MKHVSSAIGLFLIAIATTSAAQKAKIAINGNATAVALGGGIATANGTTACTTTTTPAVPPRTVVRSIPQIHVRAVMPDGTHITLWCQQSFRRCGTLSAGSYVAEVVGNSVWASALEFSGEERKIKYSYAGGW